MKADSLSCKNLSAQYNLLASRNIALKNPKRRKEQRMTVRKDKIVSQKKLWIFRTIYRKVLI